LSQKHIKKILIIATRQIGDTLITTPLISAAKRIWPDAQIDFLGYDNSLSMLSGNTDLNIVIGTKSRPKFIDYLKQFFQLFKRYDLAVITQPSDRAYIYGLIAAKHRVGVIPVEPKFNWWKKKISIHNVEVDYFHQHVITEKLRLLEPFVTEGELFSHPISVGPPKPVNLPSEIQSKLSESFVVIHPTPLTAYKRWPLTNWVKLIESLSENHQIVLSGAPIPQDRELNQAIIDLLSESAKKNVLNLDGRLKLDQLGTLLRQAKLYIGVDTSVTHLAAACDVPTITLFGATPPTNFGPWPNGFVGKQPYALKASIQKVGNVTILQGPGDCVPCRKAGCEDKPDSRSDCLINLPVSSVLEAVSTYGITFK
jgi:heptosyltransferase-3